MLKHVLILVLLLTAFQNLFCQVHITGKVIDKKDGSPIISANILVKQTKIGTATKQDGTFSLNVPDSNSVIVISFVGYEDQTVFLKGQTYFEIKLMPECSIDWFDFRQISIYSDIGIIHAPVGAKIDFSFPPFIYRQINLKTSLSYQTNLAKNNVLKAQTSLLHLFVSCNFTADITTAYKKINFKDYFNAQTFSLQAYFNFNKINLIAGYGYIDLNNINKSLSFTGSAPVVGFRKYFFIRPVTLNISATITPYKNVMEYNAGLEARFKWNTDAFISFNKINSFSEVSIGFGKKFYYRKKRK